MAPGIKTTGSPSVGPVDVLFCSIAKVKADAHCAASKMVAAMATSRIPIVLRPKRHAFMSQTARFVH
jgi:hypothetical protein